MKKPVRCCHVSPTFACVRFCVAEIAGGMLPSSPTTRPDPIVATSSLGTDPTSSSVARRGKRDGKPAPTPHRNAPLGMSKPAGSPRTSYPADPESSTRRRISLLPMKSNRKSAFPVETPTVSSPVGTFTMPRNASAAGCWRNSDHRLIFAPR